MTPTDQTADEPTPAPADAAETPPETGADDEEAELSNPTDA